jgi:hypothetical protein
MGVMLTPQQVSMLSPAQQQAYLSQTLGMRQNEIDLFMGGY